MQSVPAGRQTTQHQRHLSGGNLNNNEKSHTVGAGEIGLCCSRSPCELIVTETSLGGGSSRAAKITDSARLLISPACLFICQGKNAQCQSDIQSVSGDLSTMFRGTESMLRFILCVQCRGTSRRLGVLS